MEGHFGVKEMMEKGWNYGKKTRLEGNRLETWVAMS